MWNCGFALYLNLWLFPFGHCALSSRLSPSTLHLAEESASSPGVHARTVRGHVGVVSCRGEQLVALDGDPSTLQKTLASIEKELAKIKEDRENLVEAGDLSDEQNTLLASERGRESPNLNLMLTNFKTKLSQLLGFEKRGTVSGDLWLTEGARKILNLTLMVTKRKLLQLLRTAKRRSVSEDLWLTVAEPGGVALTPDLTYLIFERGLDGELHNFLDRITTGLAKSQEHLKPPLWSSFGFALHSISFILQHQILRQLPRTLALLHHQPSPTSHSWLSAYLIHIISQEQLSDVFFLSRDIKSSLKACPALRNIHGFLGQLGQKDWKVIQITILSHYFGLISEKTPPEPSCSNYIATLLKDLREGTFDFSKRVEEFNGHFPMQDENFETLFISHLFLYHALKCHASYLTIDSSQPQHDLSRIELCWSNIEEFQDLVKLHLSFVMPSLAKKFDLRWRSPIFRLILRIYDYPQTSGLSYKSIVFSAMKEQPPQENLKILTRWRAEMNAAHEGWIQNTRSREFKREKNLSGATAYSIWKETPLGRKVNSDIMQATGTCDEVYRDIDLTAELCLDEVKHQLEHPIHVWCSNLAEELLVLFAASFPSQQYAIRNLLP